MLTNNTGRVLCAYCGCKDIQHYEVQVYVRHENGDVKGSVYEIGREPTYILTNHSMDKNPSKYRNGIRMLCDCENCDRVTIINIHYADNGTLITATRLGEDITIEQEDTEGSGE